MIEVEDIYIRGIKLPHTVKGVVVVDENGDYNIYINNLLNYEMQLKTAEHEIKHIKLNHFYNYDPVIYNEIEASI